MKALPLYAPKALPPRTVTHEAFIHAVRETVLRRSILEAESRRRLEQTKLTYGAGENGVRGVCYYAAWQNGSPRPYDFIEVCAKGQESVTQLVGTTVHELGHVLAGHGAGHGSEWKAACSRLGLATAIAAGQCYRPEDFDPGFWAYVTSLDRPNDGNPTFGSAGLVPWVGLPTFKPRPCPLGIGTRGGKSRGKGSGSRLRLWQCQCRPAVKVRVASDAFEATCNRCGQAFSKAAP